MTTEEIRRVELQWKSDVDLKLDKLIKFMELMATREKLLTKSVDELTEVLNAAKGTMSFLFVIAKVSAAVGVILGALYAAKEWVIHR
jgi:ferritin